MDNENDNSYKELNKVENGKNIEEPDEKKPISLTVWRFMLFMGVLIYGSYTILVHVCEVDGKLPFSSASMVLTTEILKLCISASMLLPEIQQGHVVLPDISLIFPFAFPALLYCLNNNMAVHMQLEMDPASYQVLGNMKILSTAFLYRLIMKKPISKIQWFALGLLATAGVCNSYGGLRADHHVTSAGEIHISIKGLIMLSGYCVISALAGVYTEYILKRKYNTSIHLQNCFLYFFGIILNGLTFVAGSVHEGDVSLFSGYSLYTWILVVSQAVSGLIMSAIMKHGSNITRLFLISCAMLVTTLLSVAVFSLQPNALFYAAFVLVIIALYLYYKS